MKYLIAILFSCATLVSVAQVNFVKNPDFERYDTCPPDVFNTVSYASYWSSLDTNNTFTKGYGFPEYCNSCIPFSSSTEFGVPFGRYYQYPHSGNGMTHGYYFCDEPPPHLHQTMVIEIIYKGDFISPSQQAKVIAFHFILILRSIPPTPPIKWGLTLTMAV